MADSPGADWQTNLKPAHLASDLARPDADAKPSPNGRPDDHALSLALVEGLRDLRRGLDRIEERLAVIERTLAIVPPAQESLTRISAVRRSRAARAIREAATDSFPEPEALRMPDSSTS
jgi:hypothetical protein